MRRYNFKAYLSDNTASAMITFFTPKADDIVGVKCDLLVNSLNNPHPREIPENIHSIVGKRHIFQFYYNTSSKQGPPEFVFTKLLDEQDVPKQIEHIASGHKITINYIT